jgi:uncharacterized protein (TIGR02271 family)
VLPVIQERLSIDRRTVDTGARVRVRKVQEQRTVTVDEPRIERRVRIERVPCDRPVDGPLEPRVEGDVIVVPVLEERLVLEKRLFLKEEIRIVRDDIEHHEPQEVVLQGERVIVERQERPDGPWSEVAVESRSGHSPEFSAPPGERS